ncbi:CYT protein, partial [Amia calva]|nr:CYT protein [Amia calva]
MAVSWKTGFLLLAATCVVAAVGSAERLVGGPMQADLSDAGVKDALRFAVSEYNKASNDAYISKESKIIDVKKQVVAGIKYIFTVEMVRTSCRKGGVEALELCAVHGDAEVAKVMQCQARVMILLLCGHL